MKLKRPLSVLCLAPLIMGCASDSVYGTYGFQMGKETGSHFGIFLNLKNEAYKEIEEAKKFELTASIKNGTEESEASVVQEFLEFFKDEHGDVCIPGYFKMTNEKNKLGEKRMILGFDFDYLVDKIISVANNNEEVPIDLSDVDFDALNNQGLIENLLYTTHDKNMVNVYVPVSLNDAYYQLYWYGTDVKVSIDFSSEDPIKFEIVELETKHEYGTLPTASDVELINQTFANEHEHCLYTEFKQFHQVKLGLQKR